MPKWKTKRKGPNFVLEGKEDYNEGEVRELTENPEVQPEEQPQESPEPNAAEVEVVDTEELPADVSAEEKAQEVVSHDATDEELLAAIEAVKDERFRSRDPEEVDRLEGVIDDLRSKMGSE